MVIKRVDLHTNTPAITARAPTVVARLTETKDLRIHLAIDLAKLKTGLYEKFFESALFADLVVKTISLSKVETLTVSDEAPTKTIGKVAVDVAALIESVSHNFNRGAALEVLTVVEAFSVATSKPFTETPTLSDLMTLHSNKLVLDALTATDDWEGLANIDDDQYIDFGKNIVEYISIQESLIRDFAKASTETLTCVETRTAWMQDYWAFDYNAADYVGLSTAI